MKLMFILSGGLDSATALYELKSGHEIAEALTFDYGQRHRREIESAAGIAMAAGVPHRIIDIKNLQGLLGGSSLTNAGIETPEGRYMEESMKKTIVPNRNAIMINIAAGYAVSQKIYALGLGVHAGDHFIYPDCRPEFIESQQKALSSANGCDFKLLAPFLNLQKKDIVKRGFELGVPFEMTWTCYEGANKPCGKCGACTERIEAFMDNLTADPLYSKIEWEKVAGNLPRQPSGK